MMYEIHQDFFMNVSFSRNRASLSECDLRIYPRIWQIRRFEGVRFLPNSSTLAPREVGWLRRSDSTNKSRILVKTSPSERRSGHAPPWKIATIISRRFIKLPPYPYKYCACVVKLFHRFAAFFESLQAFSQKKSSWQEVWGLRLPRFSKVLFSLLFIMLFWFWTSDFVSFVSYELSYGLHSHCSWLGGSCQEHC
jgi:hypothetical protein